MKIESLASGFQSLILQPAFTKCMGAVDFFLHIYVVKKENGSSKCVGGAPGNSRVSQSMQGVAPQSTARFYLRLIWRSA